MFFFWSSRRESQSPGRDLSLVAPLQLVSCSEVAPLCSTLLCEIEEEHKKVIFLQMEERLVEVRNVNVRAMGGWD